MKKEYSAPRLTLVAVESKVGRCDHWFDSPRKAATFLESLVAVHPEAPLPLLSAALQQARKNLVFAVDLHALAMEVTRLLALVHADVPREAVAPCLQAA